MRIAMGAFMGLLMMIGLAKSVYDRYFRHKRKPASVKTTAPAKIDDPFTHADWHIRIEAIQNLEVAPVHIDTLCSMLDDADYDVRIAARDALVAIGQPAVNMLLDILQHGKPDARQISAEALGKIGDKATTQALIAALEDESKWVRLAVIESLGMFSTQTARKALAQVLDDEDDNQLVEAAQKALTS